MSGSANYGFGHGKGRFRMFREKSVDGLGTLSGGMAVLTEEELLWVSGGDDGGDAGCSAGDAGGCSSGDTGDATSAGTLSEVTVTATAEPPGIGDAAAVNLATSIDFAFTDPAAAMMAFATLLFNSIPQGATAPPPNIMGDPSPEIGGP